MTSSSNTLPTRDQVPVENTWDLTTIYPDNQSWEADFAHVRDNMSRLSTFQGRLGESGETLLEYFNLDENLSSRMGKLIVYANMRLHEDTTVDIYQSMSDRVDTLSAEYGAITSFVVPELLEIDPAKIESFRTTTAGLAIYEHWFEDLFRQKQHVRSHEVSELLAQASEVMGAPDRIYSLLSDADMQLPEITMADGQVVKLTHGNYVEKFLHSRNREDRRRGFEGMFNTYKALRNTLASLYSTQVKANIFSAKAHRYENCRQSALHGINVPESVYDNLVATVHRHLPTLHRYLRLRKKALRLDELRMFDLYVPIVGEKETPITYKEAQTLVCEALAPLGEEYVATVRQAFSSRWIDVVETQNKHSGAYSWGTYDTNPFILMNWQDTLESTYTLAHELGHSMHSYRTRKAQPALYGDYTLFVAEVASTCNEALLTHHLLKITTDVEKRKAIINRELENIRTTLIRQAMFAEFEHIAHSQAEAGESLTADALCAIHKELNDKYFGAEVEVDELIGMEWARISHFFPGFYVYQYSTGISTALSLAEQILSEGQPAVDRYLKFLSSGSSDYSINLLKAAGVDLSTPAPIDQALQRFAQLVEELEQLMSS